MTTNNTDPTARAARAARCRTANGNTIPWESLPAEVRDSISFNTNNNCGLAIWRNGKGGEEPPPYWEDDVGMVHSL